MRKKYWVAVALCFSTVILYLFFLRDLPTRDNPTAVSPTAVSPTPGSFPKLDVLRDPYVPPLTEIQILRQVPDNEYTQVGILTRGDLILPLLGRRYPDGRRDKWQYYAISNTGNLNTKLPIRINGKSATGEYGCDPIVSNDTVFVEGYKETMSATIYENNQFSYNPVVF